MTTRAVAPNQTLSSGELPPALRSRRHLWWQCRGHARLVAHGLASAQAHPRISAALSTENMRRLQEKLAYHHSSLNNCRIFRT
ncbi:hypothetical protein ACU4GI_01690 [Cupriavidus basilensis]